jgi:hypothetical protein
LPILPSSICCSPASAASLPRVAAPFARRSAPTAVCWRSARRMPACFSAARKRSRS